MTQYLTNSLAPPNHKNTGYKSHKIKHTKLDSVSLLTKLLLKGQCHNFFNLLFHDSNPSPWPLVNLLKYLCILFRFWRDICSGKKLGRVKLRVYGGVIDTAVFLPCPVRVGAAFLPCPVRAGADRQKPLEWRQPFLVWGRSHHMFQS